MKTPLTTLVLLALLSFPLAAQRTRPVDVSVQGFQARPFCPTAMDDMTSGACLPASSTPTMGALYPLSVDFNLDPATGFVGLGTTAPVQRLHVVGSQFLGGDLLFHNNNDGIVFSSDAPLFQFQQPMITMFTGGTSNPDRMVLAHSNAFSDYGLEYRDAGDEFVFQRSPTAPVLVVDLNDQRTTQYDANGNPAAFLDGPGHSVGVMTSTAVTVAQLRANLGGTLELGQGNGGIEMHANGGGGNPLIRIAESDGSATLISDQFGLRLFNSNGNVTINFDRQSGAKNAVVRTESHGQRLLYNEESTEVWFTDHGSGRLAGGTARIELDSVFLETVVVDADHPMRVFVTMTAESMPVWVEKGTESFVVHEQLDGKSDATFDYRVMAKRRGLENARLEPFEAD